jgi:hypothetical protein
MDKKWWEIPAVSLLILALAVLSTWPLARYFDTGIPYAPFGGVTTWNRSGDQIQLMYWFWLVKENFLGTVPFNSNPFEFNMPGPHAGSGLNTVPLAFLYMLFSPLGDVAAYNAVIFSSYLLAGLFMYLLVREYSGCRTGALLAAIIFTFAPARIRGLAAGHGYGLLFFCYPFILYYLELGIRTRRVRYGVISGIGLMGLAMLEPHLIYYISVFLALYIPLRVPLLFPVPTARNSVSSSHTVTSLPVAFSLLIIWAAGASGVVYSQLLFHCRDRTGIPGEYFWLALGLYPVLFMLVTFCCAALWQRLSVLDFRQSLAVEAGSTLPMFLLLPLCWWNCRNDPLGTGPVLLLCVAAMLLLKIWLLRNVLPSMFQGFVQAMLERKKHLYPVLCLVLSMGAVVGWIVLSKVQKISGTIAGGGRTLADVSLFSARISDLFISTSGVYIGVVPAVIGAMILLRIFKMVPGNGRDKVFVSENGFLALFYMTVASGTLLLSLGLAFGKFSLYALFYYFFPFFNYPRVSDRIITLTLFCLAVLSGYAVQLIIGRCRKRACRGLVILCVLGAAVFQLRDYHVSSPMAVNILDRGQTVYSYLKEHIGDGKLLEIPIWPGDSHQSSLYQHYIMLDRIPRINGCSPLVQREYIKTIFDPLNSINQGRLGPEQYELLRRLDVRYITVHDNRDIFLHKVSPYKPLITIRRLKNSPYLEYIDLPNRMYFKKFDKKNDHLALFRVKDEDEVQTGPVPSWYDMPFFYDINQRLRHQTGGIVREPGSGQWVFEAIEGKHAPGFLVYGPYDTYPPGSYRCYFDLYVAGSGKDPIARVEVSRVQDGTSMPLVEKELFVPPGGKGKKRIPLEFTLSRNTIIEFRVFYYGRGTVRVEKLVVHEQDRDAPLFSLEAESMVGDTGDLVIMRDASNTRGVEAVAGRDRAGDLVFGPSRIYNAGTYQARFFMRWQAVNGSGPGTVAARVSVTDGNNAHVYGKRAVTGNEIAGTSFVPVDLDFTLPAAGELSFHVRFTGKGRLQLDRIEIQRK